MGTIVRLLLAVLLLVGCKSSKELATTRVHEDNKDKVELSTTDIQTIKNVVSDLSVNLNKRLDFVVYDTNRPAIEGKPPILLEGTLTDNSIITDKGSQQEQVTDNSEVILQDKGQVNIRDELQSSEKKNNKTWIEQFSSLLWAVAVVGVLGYLIYRKMKGRL